MTNDLKQHLKSNPNIESVFFNDKNEWQFHKRAGYTKEVSRDDVLKMKVAEDKPVKAETQTTLLAPPAPVVSPEDKDKLIADIKEQLRAELLAELKSEIKTDTPAGTEGAEGATGTVKDIKKATTN